MATNRYRVMHKFWLDIRKDDEDQLDEAINHLKHTRKFTQTIRDGLRLILDLRRGRVDVLLELFPWVQAEFLSALQPPPSPAEQALSAALARIEQQLGNSYTAPTASRYTPLPEVDSLFLDDDPGGTDATETREIFAHGIGDLFSDDDDPWDD